MSGIVYRLDLAEEFRRNPYGRHSGELQHILNLFRTGPFAGKYVQEIAGFMDDLNPLGLEMAKSLIAALGGDPKTVEGFGKGAIEGVAGSRRCGQIQCPSAV